MKILFGIIVITCLFTANTIVAKDIATLRDGVDISTQNQTSTMAKPITNDIKVGRNYPMQPPIIPHNIRGYQLDKNVNTCLSCHSRQRVEDTQATMISVTHYMNREGNFLANISPRRYFCTQCHVTQMNVKPLVPNEFVDMDKLILRKEQKRNRN